MQKNGAGSCEAGPFKANSDNAQALHSANASQSQPVVLRPYQHDAVERIRNSYRAGSRRVLLTAPTGSGKTVIFSYVVSGALARGSRVLVIVHRVELVKDFAKAFAVQSLWRRTHAKHMRPRLRRQDGGPRAGDGVVAFVDDYEVEPIASSNRRSTCCLAAVSCE